MFYIVFRCVQSILWINSRFCLKAGLVGGRASWAARLKHDVPISHELHRIDDECSTNVSLPFDAGTHYNYITIEFAFILRLYIAVVLLYVDYKLMLFGGEN